MLFGVERKMRAVLDELKGSYGLRGIKCEFEAEGSRFEDVVRLRELAGEAGVQVCLKIGGAEAKRDVLDALTLGADGLIAPMIESEFAAYKFRKLIESIYPPGERRPEMAINIESKTSIERFGPIVEQLEGFVQRVTFGRTDLSQSYFKPDITPDSDFILDLVERKAQELQTRGLKATMGGSISVQTVAKLRARPAFSRYIEHIETRKCILPTATMLEEGALAKCFEFERLYLISVRERNDLFNRANTERLLKLEQRGV